MDKQKTPTIKFPKERKYYTLSYQLIDIIHDAVMYGHGILPSNWRSVECKNMTMRLVVRFPGQSVELLINNEKVFEAGKFLLSGVVIYSKFKEEAITLGILNRLFKISDLVETAEDDEVSAEIRSEAKRKLSKLIKDV